MGLKPGTILTAKDGEKFEVIAVFMDMVCYKALQPIFALDDSDWWADLAYIKETFTYDGC